MRGAGDVWSGLQSRTNYRGNTDPYTFFPLSSTSCSFIHFLLGSFSSSLDLFLLDPSTEPERCTIFTSTTIPTQQPLIDENHYNPDPDLSTIHHSRTLSFPVSGWTILTSRSDILYMILTGSGGGGRVGLLRGVLYDYGVGNIMDRRFFRDLGFGSFSWTF